MQEAVEIRRELFRSDLDTYRLELAESVFNLVPYLRGHDQGAEMLVSCKEAILLSQRLYKFDMKAHRAHLAWLLSQSGERKRSAGRCHEALCADKELVELQVPDPTGCEQWSHQPCPRNQQSQH